MPKLRPSRPNSESSPKKIKPAFVPVVGIGASAGGLEAFSELLQHLPQKTGLAFAYVQHLDPKDHSHLREILQRITKMPVSEARDGMKVEANHVYIVPPNVQMKIAKGMLHLKPRPEAPAGYLPIDAFFRSLAEECDGTSIGVVLSGNANDGSQVLKVIKSGGGITFAQDEASAKFPGMPRSAAQTGSVDFVLRPNEIANEIARLGKHRFVAQTPAMPAPPNDARLRLCRAGEPFLLERRHDNERKPYWGAVQAVGR